jgi:hypothetical protein
LKASISNRFFDWNEQWINSVCYRQYSFHSIVEPLLWEKWWGLCFVFDSHSKSSKDTHDFALYSVAMKVIQIPSIFMVEKPEE